MLEYRHVKSQRLHFMVSEYLSKWGSTMKNTKDKKIKIEINEKKAVPSSLTLIVINEK